MQRPHSSHAGECNETPPGEQPVPLRRPQEVGQLFVGPDAVFVALRLQMTWPQPACGVGIELAGRTRSCSAGTDSRRWTSGSAMPRRVVQRRPVKERSAYGRNMDGTLFRRAFRGLGGNKKRPCDQGLFSGAGDKIRTGDPHLGKAIWQMRRLLTLGVLSVSSQVRGQIERLTLGHWWSSLVILAGAEQERKSWSS